MIDLKKPIGKKKAGPDAGSGLDAPVADEPNGGQDRAGGFTLSGLPQVDLLPPSVRDGRWLSARKRILFFVVLGVIGALVLGMAAFYILKLNADNRLADAQDRATQLVAEKRKYSEVSDVISSINSTKEVRDFSVVTEVSWADYIDAIAAELPAGVSIQSFEVQQASPTEPATAVSDPITATGLGTISFEALSPSLPDASDWMDRLNTIAGFQDAAIQVSSLDTQVGSENETSSGLKYTVNATVQINDLALAKRVFDDEAAASDTDDKSNADSKATQEEKK